jgi:sulfite reductase (NADPH) hemoprotein beta-component
MDAVARLAEEFGHDEIRVTHEQNLVLPHVALADLEPLYRALLTDGLATANAGLITDIIACPGLDYCALANARSIPVAQDISNRFGDPARQAEIGDLKIKISGCINACGHHHVGHIGILGVEKKGAELYQISLGGSGDENASIGEIIGRGFEPGGLPMLSRRSSTPISKAAPRPTRPLSNATAALAPILSRPRFMAARPKPPEAWRFQT